MSSHIFSWILDPQNWSGMGGIPHRLFEHLAISLFAVALGSVVAVPAGMLIGHKRRGELVATSFSNFGRAVPSFAILALALPLTLEAGLGFGFWPTVIALVFLSLPPLLTNTYVGISTIDAEVPEAARAMGLSELQILSRVELPIAAPIILSGVRTATVQVIATATLAALVAWGGLGRFIVDGFATRNIPKVFGGAVLVALLAIAVEVTFAVAGRLAAPRTQSD